MIVSNDLRSLVVNGRSKPTVLSLGKRDLTVCIEVWLVWPSCGCSVVAYLLLCVGCNIYAAELLNKRERRTEVSHEALIMHSHNCFVTVFVGVI